MYLRESPKGGTISKHEFQNSKHAKRLTAMLHVLFGGFDFNVHLGFRISNVWGGIDLFAPSGQY